MLKPIEQGCLAIVISGLGCGLSVTVGRFLGGSVIPDCDHKDIWIIEDVSTPMPGVIMEASESCLMRIDDYDSSNDVETEEIEQEQTA